MTPHKQLALLPTGDVRTFLDFLLRKEATTGDVHAATVLGNQDKDGKGKRRPRTISPDAKLPVTGLTAAAEAVHGGVAQVSGQNVHKVGARHSKADTDMIQAVHDHACALGARCAGGAEPDAAAETYMKRNADWSIPLTIAKADPEKRLVFGWASIVERDGRPVIDKQGDIIPADELEKAAYDFMLYSRENDDLHAGTPTGRCIESIVFTKEKQDVLGIDLGKIGWWIGFRIDDDRLWAALKRGERPEFSIGGSAVRDHAPWRNP